MERLTLDKVPKQSLSQIDIETAFMVSRLIVAAERIQVFRLLHGEQMKADAIGRGLKIHKNHLEPFLNVLVALGLLRKANGRYWNSRLATKYFIKERSIYWTRQYSKECARAYEALTVLEEALRSGKGCRAIKDPQAPSYVESMKRDPNQARDFTQMLLHYHRDDAKALADYLDLSDREAVLDVGGGSGVMSIALAKRHRHLRACILDIGPVCEIAAENIHQAGLSGRVTTQAGDIHNSLPKGYDVIMFCDVGSLPKTMLQNAFRALPANGLVVLVDRYLSRDATQPLDRIAAHFISSSFGLATWPDMVDELTACGFTSVKARNVYRDLWFITAIKPGPGKIGVPRSATATLGR